MLNQGEQQYTFKHGSYNFHLHLQQQLLDIKIFCNDSFVKYCTDINTQSIQNHKNLSFFFSKPQQLYTYLISNHHLIKILNNGTIFFPIEIALGQIIKTYQCLLQTQKQELQPQNIIKLKMQKLQKQVQIIKEQHVKIKIDLQRQDNDMLQIRNKIQNCQKIIITKDQIINTIFHQLKELNKWREEYQKKIQNISCDKKKFVVDQTNPHFKKFVQIGNRYRKIGGGTWDSLTCKYSIEKNDVIKYNIKQIKAGMNGSFMYGIGTQAVKGLNRAQDNKQFIGYYENTGNIYEQGESKKGGSKIKDGEIITIEVDTKKWKISWSIQGKKQAQSIIPNDLKIKQLYLTLVIYNQDSQIQFI